MQNAKINNFIMKTSKDLLSNVPFFEFYTPNFKGISNESMLKASHAFYNGYTVREIIDTGNSLDKYPSNIRFNDLTTKAYQTLDGFIRTQLKRYFGKETYNNLNVFYNRSRLSLDKHLIPLKDSIQETQRQEMIRNIVDDYCYRDGTLKTIGAKWNICYQSVTNILIHQLGEQEYRLIANRKNRMPKSKQKLERYKIMENNEKQIKPISITQRQFDLNKSYYLNEIVRMLLSEDQSFKITAKYQYSQIEDEEQKDAFGKKLWEVLSYRELLKNNQ